MTTMTSARQAVLSVGLTEPDRPGAWTEPISGVVVDDDAAFCDAVISGRVVGLALAAIDDGAVVVSDGVVDRLAAAQRESAAVALRLESELLAVDRLLAESGIPCRVLKGPALAHVAYPDPAWREFGDIDLLIGGSDLPAAVAVLERAAFRRTFPSVGRRYEEQVAKSVTVRSAAGWEIDLHRTLASGPWGVLVDPADLWSDVVRWDLGGRSLGTFSAELHLAHALVHVGLGSPRPRLSNLRDLLELDAAGADRATVLAWLDRWSARAPAAAARAFLPAALRPRLGWLGEPQPTARERRWLELYRRSPQPFRRLTLEALVATGVSPRSLRYLRAVAPLVRTGGTGR